MGKMKNPKETTSEERGKEIQTWYPDGQKKRQEKGSKQTGKPHKDKIKR